MQYVILFDANYPDFTGYSCDDTAIIRTYCVAECFQEDHLEVTKRYCVWFVNMGTAPVAHFYLYLFRWFI